MPRLFTGLQIPAGMADYLGSLRGSLPGARFIEPENYHITLRFIGDIGISMANEIADMLAQVRRKNFTLQLTELSSFGRDSPRSIVALLSSTPELLELQADHERMMKRLGLSPENRKYIPHITIARLKPDAAPYLGPWVVSRSPLASKPFNVSRFVLYSSRDSAGGGPYVIENDYPLLAG